MTSTASIISKVWSFCNALRDDGVSYGDYLEQLTYLLFLKMADEYGKPPYKRKTNIPTEYSWAELRKRSGAELEGHYIKTLRELGKQKGILGQIFTKSQLIKVVVCIIWVVILPVPPPLVVCPLLLTSQNESVIGPP